MRCAGKWLQTRELGSSRQGPGWPAACTHVTCVMDDQLPQHVFYRSCKPAEEEGATLATIRLEVSCTFLGPSADLYSACLRLCPGNTAVGIQRARRDGRVASRVSAPVASSPGLEGSAPAECWEHPPMQASSGRPSGCSGEATTPHEVQVPLGSACLPVSEALGLPGILKGQCCSRSPQ